MCTAFGPWGGSSKWVCVGDTVKYYRYYTDDCSGSANITDPCDGEQGCSSTSVCNKGPCDTINIQFFNDSTCTGSSGDIYYVVDYCYGNYFKYDCTDGQAIGRFYDDEHTSNCAGNPTNTTTYVNNPSS